MPFVVRALAALCLGVIGAFSVSMAEAAQVAPNIVFINSGERGAELTIRNGAQTPIEVEVRIVFGYEDTDGAGRVRAVYPESSDGERSAAEWIRAYPRRAVIPPESRQSIRLFSRAPSGIEAGEYWARIQVESRPTQIEAQDAAGGEDVQVRVGVTTRQRIPLFVRVGEASASLAVGEARARLRQDAREDRAPQRHIEVRYRTRLAGNAAFLGTMQARLEREGRILATQEVPLAVFVPGIRRVRIPLDEELSAADLRQARLILEARREHPAINSRDLLAGRALRWEGPLALE